MSRVLLISGLGPSFLNTYALEGTLLTDVIPQDVAASYSRLAGHAVDLRQFRIGGPDGELLLRPWRGVAPHLPTATVRSILDVNNIEHEWLSTDAIWYGTIQPPAGDFDIVGLSTTFVWDAATLTKAVTWIHDRYPAATVVLGGQYSNLKYADILKNHREVKYVIRGDAEIGLPALVTTLATNGDLSKVPNLAWLRADGTVEAPPIQYIDLEAHPSPTFKGKQAMVPYESMRGCPFTCKFCSFPAASPQWRYKSADKIVADWTHYAEHNEAQLIRAYDSTFTIPPTRFNALLDRLPSVGVPWEGYSRANTLGTKEVVQKLEASKCRRLFIGFESMNPVALKNMDKKVTLAQNHRAIEALRGTSMEVRASFMVGYPGETPDDYKLTHNFLVNDYQGLFNVHFFMFSDETMPVWDDAPLYDLEVTNGWTWKHSGMDSVTANRLRTETLHTARWKNDHAVHDLWQPNYMRPFMANLTMPNSIKLEKALERLAYLVKDRGEGEDAAATCRGLLDELSSMGVWTGSAERGAAQVS
jgi:radical SAM superfamily enzyme YgiQ (UPF0313 family)